MWLGDGEKEPGRGAQFCTFGQEWSVITSGGGGGEGERRVGEIKVKLKYNIPLFWAKGDFYTLRHS